MNLNDLLPPSWANRAKEYFTYAVDFLPLAAGARVSQNITIQNDADFVLLAARARVNDPAAVATVVADPAITVQISNTGTNQLQSQPVPMGCFYSMTGLAAGGAAGNAGEFQVPYVFKAGSTLGTTLVSLDAVNPWDARLVYVGFKVYYFEWGV